MSAGDPARGLPWRRSALLALALLCALPARAEQRHLIGVLAGHDGAAVKAALQPTADYLSKALPGHRFAIVPLPSDELQQAVARGTLDLVFTDPASYALLEAHHQVNRIATLQGGERGSPVKEIGGVVAVRLARDDLRSVADLRRRRIGISSEAALNAYAAQAGLLREFGLDIGDDVVVDVVGDSQEQVLAALRDGRVDAGFLKAGALEQLNYEGKIRIDDFKVLNPRLLAGYPFLVSTALYPEWPLATTAKTPEEVAKAVAVALLRMTPQSVPARSAEYQGWTLPMNYQGVHDLLRSLGLPPYPRGEGIRLRDVIRKYDLALVGSLLLTLLLVALAGGRYAYISSRLRRTERIRVRAERRLIDENQLLAMLAHGVSLSSLLRELVQRYLAEYPGDTMQFLLYEPGLRRFRLAPAADGEAAPPAGPWLGRGHVEEVALRRTLAALPADCCGCDIPIASPGGEILGHMIVGRRRGEGEFDRELLVELTNIAAVAIEHSRNMERIRLDATIVANTLEAISIANARGRVLDINPALIQLTGYGRDELAGRKLATLLAGRHDRVFYRNILRSLFKYGYWRGEVWNRRKDGHEFPTLLSLSTVRNALGQISHFVAAFSDITEIKESQTRLERLANYDPLTELPNRVLLTDRFHQAIAQAQRHKTMLGICFIDLDRFKPVNDKYGHAAGDRLLVEVAQRLRKAVRASDTVARLGGDEFVILINDIEDPNELGSSLSRLIDDVALPIQLDQGVRVEVSASIGVTLYPHDANDPDVLLRHADQAMYKAKQEGRNCFHIFDPGQDLQVQLIVSQRQQMRNALAQGEFRLHYQPQVDMRDGTVVGVEALLRWEAPGHGLRLPGDFLPAIEHHELIVEVGDWVLQEALRQRQQWLEAGIDLAVGVNIAPLQLVHADFSQRLAALLRQYPAAGGRLELEILETAALGDSGEILRIIRSCQRMGVNLALDDFGTGYSSLAYLRQLPVDTMKVDRSFVAGMVRDAGELAIVESILGLAGAFQRRVVAEGVETEEHGALLLRLGCPIGQGYAIARPMPGAELAAWIAGYRIPPAWASWRNTEAGRDFFLVKAEIEHRNWVRHLVNALGGAPIVLPAEHISDPTRCQFGRWFHQQGKKRYGGQPLYRQVEDEHREAHRIGARIMGLVHAGDLAAAEKLELPLVAASERMLDALTTLQRAGPY